MSEQAKPTVAATGNPFDIFVIGARKGFTVSTQNLLPNVLMAYTLIQVLNILGVMKFLGDVLGPVMAIFGLPGEAAIVLMGVWLSASGGVGAAAGLYTQGILSDIHITLLMPACFLMGSQLQYMGRLLGVADVPKKYWPLLMMTSILNALLSILIMRFFV